MATIEELINNISQEEFTKANTSFNDILQSKIDDVLEAEKIKLSASIYNDIDIDDEEQLELDFDEDDTEEEAEEDIDTEEEAEED